MPKTLEVCSTVQPQLHLTLKPKCNYPEWTFALPAEYC